LVLAVRQTQKLLGVVDYSLNEKRKDQRRFCRSIYVCKTIKQGEVFSLENLKSVRPGYSMHPKYLNTLLGQKAKKDYHLGERIEEYPHSL
jgi:pseudaminic acid synthase